MRLLTHFKNYHLFITDQIAKTEARLKRVTSDRGYLINEIKLMHEKLNLIDSDGDLLIDSSVINQEDEVVDITTIEFTLDDIVDWIIDEVGNKRPDDKTFVTVDHVCKQFGTTHQILRNHFSGFSNIMSITQFEFIRRYITKKQFNALLVYHQKHNGTLPLRKDMGLTAKFYRMFRTLFLCTSNKIIHRVHKVIIDLITSGDYVDLYDPNSQRIIGDIRQTDEVESSAASEEASEAESEEEVSEDASEAESEEEASEEE
jgi:hypothetical protein